jgi:hypothetical protein
MLTGAASRAGYPLPHGIRLAGRQLAFAAKKRNRIKFSDERGFDLSQMIRVLWMTHFQALNNVRVKSEGLRKKA